MTARDDHQGAEAVAITRLCAQPLETVAWMGTQPREGYVQEVLRQIDTCTRVSLERWRALPIERREEALALLLSALHFCQDRAAHGLQRLNMPDVRPGVTA